MTTLVVVSRCIHRGSTYHLYGRPEIQTYAEVELLLLPTLFYSTIVGNLGKMKKVRLQLTSPPTSLLRIERIVKHYGVFRVFPLSLVHFDQ
jgi:hypothetical protein